jgi:hypothetical protein
MGYGHPLQIPIAYAIGLPECELTQQAGAARYGSRFTRMVR